MAEAVHPRLAGADQREERATRPPRAAARGFKLGEVAGIELRVDWSLAIVFWLIVINLGAGLFPALHPDWGPALAWSVAIGAALLFFLSVLAHELAHAVVGRARGVPIEGITLFLFGGVARLAGEPKSAGTEFLMAIVGPLTSFAIGIAAIAAGAALSRGGNLETLAALGPASTVLLWLGSTNLALAIFNLLPGFPLDGGRVLRAILWKITGDVKRATRYASAAGRVVAMLLIFAGVMMAFGMRVPFLGSGFAQGLWLVLIGWFLNNAAINSYRQLVVTELLAGVPVARLMRTEIIPVPPLLPVSALVDRFFMEGDQRSFPVMEGDVLDGLVTMGDLRKVARDRWESTPVRAIMTPAAELTVARPDENAADALAKLGAQDLDQLPVLDGGQLVGFLRRADLLRWIELQGGG